MIIKTALSIFLLGFLAFNFLQAENSFSLNIGNPMLLMGSFLASSAVLGLTSLRLKVVVGNITKPNTRFLLIHRINVKSQLFGLFFPNVIGLVFSRAFLLSSVVKSKEMVPILTLAEKIISMLVLMSICFLVTLGMTTFEILRDFLEKILFLLCVVTPIIFLISVCLFKFRFIKLFYRIIKSCLRNFTFFNQLILNIPIFFLSCVSFLMLAKFYSIEASNLDLIPLIFLVLFISSLPISISGWGVREASASFFFHHFFSAAVEGVAIGLTFGLVNMGALISFYFLDMLASQKQENS